MPAQTLSMIPKRLVCCSLAIFLTLQLGAQEATVLPERQFTVRKEWVRQLGGQTVTFQRVDPPPAVPPAVPLPPAKAPDLSPQELEIQRQRETKAHIVLLLSATAITAQHIINAKHLHLNVNDTIRFISFFRF